jgi:PIN like domain
LGFTTDIDRQINRLIKERNQHVLTLQTEVKSWNWNDPVTLLYREVFTEDCIELTPVDRERVYNDLLSENALQIPPGYKDSRKPDKGVGDRLIWQSILKVGERCQRNVILVSGETKYDWWVGADKDSLYPRFELSYEFWSRSNQRSFWILSFEDFLKLQKASAQLVRAAEVEELLRTRREYTASWIRSGRAIASVEKWLRDKYGDEAINPEGVSHFDFQVTHGNGDIGLVRVESVRTSPETMLTLAHENETAMEAFGYKLAACVLVIAAYSTEQAVEVSEFIKQNWPEGPRIKLVIGDFDDGGFRPLAA